MKKSWVFIILSGLLILVMAGCDAAEIQPTPGEQSQATPVVEETATTDDDMDGDHTDDTDAADDSDTDTDHADETETEMIDAAAIYSQNCSSCHGANREGGGGPALLPERLTKDPSAYVATITNGSGPMPTFEGKLTTEEINALVEFLLSDVE